MKSKEAPNLLSRASLLILVMGTLFYSISLPREGGSGFMRRSGAVDPLSANLPTAPLVARGW